MSARENALNRNIETESQNRLTQSTLVNNAIPVISIADEGEDCSRKTLQTSGSLVRHITQPKSYAAMVGEKKNSRMKLSFIPLEIVDGKLVVKYQSSDVMIGINRWKSTTFGYVLGINPSFGAIENFARNRWNVFGFEKYFKLSLRVFLFKFESDEGRDAMLDEGMWIFAQYPMIVSSWTPESNLERRGVEKILVWVKIPFLSLQFWNDEMLSKIGSYIGNNFFVDGAT
ncbi:hypothetical protein LIER_40247 [Lithospermum erythrorhizon]|uniref:DUF4283 domain-containing protein n=1 Tax=Lithospermum erythrorhizon TaxID=34254 RepID=A0AAV3QRS2_LITER